MIDKINKTLLIDVSEDISWVFKLDNGKPEDMIVFKNDIKDITGNIYKGIITKVINELQIVFIQYMDHKREGLLNIKDINKEFEYKVGQYIMVQVVQEEGDKKGAKLTENITLSGKYIKYLPFVNTIQMSNNICEKYQKRLSLLLNKLSKKYKAGFIAKTQAIYISIEEIEKEAVRLVGYFQKIKQEFKDKNEICELYNNNDIVLRVFNDFDISDIAQIYSNDLKSKNKIEELKKYYSINNYEINIFLPKFDLLGSFDLFKEIEKLLNKKVPLNNGGELIIEPTEALITIDVNTAFYFGEKNRENTALSTNLLACDEIARQLKLRNLGGIIVIDFINMEKKENKIKVLNRLKQAFSCDVRETRIFSFSELSLVEMTRSKSYYSIYSLLTENHIQEIVFNPYYIIRKIMSKLKEILYYKIYRNLLIYCNINIYKKLKPLKFKNEVEASIYAVVNDKFKQNEFEIKGDNSICLNLPECAKFLY